MPKTIPENTTYAAFENSYWHRSSLVQFCRAKGLPTGGCKTDLTARIAAYLSGAPLPETNRQSRASMPTEFTLDTVIQSGWHCSQPLRAFFQSHCKTRFHFSKAMREFIASAEGKTLADGLVHWHETRTQTQRPIDVQFEYNRFLRQYHASHPSAGHSAAIAAWKIHRDTPINERS